MRRYILLFLFLLLFLSPILGWSGKTHQRIVEKALDSLPRDFKNRIIPYKNEILEGSIAPDRVYRDFQNHIYEVETGKGKGLDKVREKYFYIIELIREKRPWRLVAFELGVFSHYIADLNQPLHTSSSSQEKGFHSKYEKDAEQIVPNRADRLIYISQPTRYIYRSVLDAHNYYKDIETAYLKGNGFVKVSKLTQKQIDKATLDVASYWYSIWMRANRIPTINDLFNDFVDWLWNYFRKILRVEVK
ncbi:MAG: hypothetical protein CBR30_08755 [Dictyoglomus sp. NZ13-RE01]|nr:MAG: hypothetical protein CBR30_08755 [Dictyoglomus sp. NZ13-RE01]